MKNPDYDRISSTEQNKPEKYKKKTHTSRAKRFFPLDQVTTTTNKQTAHLSKQAVKQVAETQLKRGPSTLLTLSI